VEFFSRYSATRLPVYVRSTRQPQHCTPPSCQVDGAIEEPRPRNSWRRAKQFARSLPCPLPLEVTKLICGCSVTLSALVNLNISVWSSQFFPVQFQFLRTCQPLCLELHTNHQHMGPTHLSFSTPFFFFSTDSSPKLPIHPDAVLPTSGATLSPTSGATHLPHLLPAYIAHSAVRPLPFFAGVGALPGERREREAEAEVDPAARARERGVQSMGRGGFLARGGGGSVAPSTVGLLAGARAGAVAGGPPLPRTATAWST
jgi:hypothetical protein